MHRPLSEWDMALITVMCQEGEARCSARARTAALTGNKVAEKAAITDQWRYRSLRLKMFALGRKEEDAKGVADKAV